MFYDLSELQSAIVMTQDASQRPDPSQPADSAAGELSGAPRKVGNKADKDLWDKLSSLSTFLSTVLIATLGGVFTYLFNAREAKHQHNIQETQAVTQLMPYLTSKDEKQQRTALIAVKALQDASLMVNLAASDPMSPGARQALREVAFNSADEKDRSIAADALRQFEFVPACPLPFPDPPVTQPIDNSLEHSCGMFGFTDLEALKAENFAKNNFCAGMQNRNTRCEPELVDFDKLNKLQAQVERDHSINWGNPHNVDHSAGPTTNREQLRQFGEGNLVTLKGYVLIARQEGAESVNCGANVPNDPTYHDIHIVVVPSANETNECNSIVVEMSPHHRPFEWTASNLNDLAQSHIPVRVTGQLFFDSSHVPCQAGQASLGSPKRSSLWEIHPIYKFEVCPANCDVEENWITIAGWLKKRTE
jgi:hypothetical protein